MTNGTLEAVQISAGDVALVAFQPAWIALAWEWLNQYPEANFDDDSPRTLEAFAQSLLERVKAGNVILGVVIGGVPVGIVGFQKITKRVGQFAGICFTKEVHGKGVAFAALKMLLDSLFIDGYEKIEASFFVTNERMAGLFRKLGFHEEGRLIARSVQDGSPLDVSIMGLLRSGGG